MMDWHYYKDDDDWVLWKGGYVWRWNLSRKDRAIIKAREIKEKLKSKLRRKKIR